MTTTLVVTGASGFIGGRLCAAAKSQGISVVAVGHDSSPVVSGARCLSWREFLETTFPSSTVCCHLGEQGNIATFNGEGERYGQEALSNARAVIEKRFLRLVYASTCAVYAPDAGRALSEDDAVDHGTSYVRSKLEVERAVSSVNGYNLRLANVYGPGMSPGTVIPTLVSQLMGDDAAVSIRCTTDERDFIHVDDVVAAFLALITGDVPGGTYNVSTGVRTSIAQLYDLLAEILGRRKPLQAIDTRAGTSLALSPDKAHRLFGWQSRVPLADGLRDTFQRR